MFMGFLKYSELCIRTTLTFTIHFKLRITILNIRNILSFPFNELIVKVYKNVLQFYKMTSFEKKNPLENLSNLCACRPGYVSGTHGSKKLDSLP